MDSLFLTILNMSATGAFVIIAICIARLFLKKAPKIISYCIWAVAAFRLVCPVAIVSQFSFLPFAGDPIKMPVRVDPVGPSVVGMGNNVSFGSAFDAAFRAVGDAINGGLGMIAIRTDSIPGGYIYAYHSEVWVIFGSYIWIFGVIALLIYGIVSFFILKHKMQNSIHSTENVYEANNIRSPFVLGIICPKIYLPVGLSSNEYDYIILHERIHIKRRDYIIKFVAYTILCIHWFNPLVWIAYLLMSADMEMSCDERVLIEKGAETKKDYSLSLLSLAAERRIITGSPLAFGEGSAKERVKNVLNFKKPSRVVIIAAVACALILSVGFVVNRDTENHNDFQANQFIGQQSTDIIFELQTNAQGNDLHGLLEQTQVVLEKRIFEMGLSDSVSLVIEGDKRIRAEMHGVGSVEEIIRVLGTTGRFEVLLADGTFILDSTDISDSIVEADPNNDGYLIGLMFTPAGTEKFYEATVKAYNQEVQSPFMEGIFEADQIAIVLDDRILIAPSVGAGPISSNRVVITRQGGFDQAYANSISILVRSKHLPADMLIIEP